MTCFRLACPLALVLGNNSVVLAHHEPSGGGWMAGLTHPLYGIDHLLAMLAVGLLAAKLAGPGRWTMPAAFLVGMLGGAALSLVGVGLPGVEPGIALSVIALGAMLAFAWRLPLPAAAIVVAAMGALHGHAHGSEMPQLAQPALYAAGFVIATATLHLVGIGLGQLILAPARRVRWSWLGSAVATAGVVLLVNVLK